MEWKERNNVNQNNCTKGEIIMDEKLYGSINGYCRNCNSQNLQYYDGMLSYEAIVCQECGTHHTNAEPIIPKEKNHEKL